MSAWLPYRDAFPGEGHTPVGDLRVRPRFCSSILRNERAVVVHLPPSYGRRDRAYPVVYMMDGQNLFDPRRAHSIEWRVDQTMARVAGEGIEAIVVAIDNAGERRTDEYSPFAVGDDGGGRAAEFLRCLSEEIMPEVASAFRVSPRPADTHLAGASLGALFCLYALCERPDRFGGAGLLSPSLWPGGRAIFDHLDRRPRIDARVYVDVGTRELSGRASALKLHRRTRAFVGDARRLHELLVAQASDPATVRYVEERGAHHGEAAWRRRFPGMVRFLLAAEDSDTRTNQASGLDRNRPTT